MREQYSIFASVGNSTQPFDRFLRMVDDAAGIVNRSALMQTGTSSYQPRHAVGVDYVGREEFDDLCRDADYLVMHAGVGSVMAAMRFGKLPIIVPRRGDLGESVNSHQFELATELSKLGWCRIAAGLDDLLEFLQAPPPPVPMGEDLSNRRMRDLVSDFIR